MYTLLTAAEPLAPVMVFCPKSPSVAGVADMVHCSALALPPSTTVTRVTLPRPTTYSLCQTHLTAISS